MWRKTLGLKGGLENKAWSSLWSLRLYQHLFLETLAIFTQVWSHVDMPSTRTHRDLHDHRHHLTLTHRLPGEHRQAIHTSIKHTCTPLATEAHKHKCRKQCPLLMEFEAHHTSTCVSSTTHHSLHCLVAGAGVQSLCDLVKSESGHSEEAQSLSLNLPVASLTV